jgi:hypothetical protein
MRGSSLLIPLVFVSLAAAACGVRTRFTPLNPSPVQLHARAVEEIAILQAPPAQPHVEIGTIEVERMSNSDADYDRMILELRKAAASHGCEAVLLIRGKLSGIRAACIVYAPDARVEQHHQPRTMPMNETPPSPPAPPASSDNEDARNVPLPEKRK